MPSIGWVRLIGAVAAWGGREVVLDGCTYAEQLQAVAVGGGVAGNVVPDRATVALNHRYAPDRQALEAEAFVRQLVQPLLEPEDEWELVDAGDGAPPRSATAARRPGGEERRRPQGQGWLDRWPPSGSTACRRRTSVPATRCWPTTRRAGDPGPAQHTRRVLAGLIA